MKKTNKQVNQKQKQNILNAVQLLKRTKDLFGGTNKVVVETYPVSVGLLGRVKEEKKFYEVNGFRATTNPKVEAIKTVSPEFLEEVANFLVKEPNNVHAQNITKTLIKGANFE